MLLYHRGPETLIVGGAAMVLAHDGPRAMRNWHQAQVAKDQYVLAKRCAETLNPPGPTTAPSSWK